jgi:hypothetical protein
MTIKRKERRKNERVAPLSPFAQTPHTITGSRMVRIRIRNDIFR